MAVALVHLISTYRKKKRRVNKRSSMFEQFKVLAGMIEQRERERERREKTLTIGPNVIRVKTTYTRIP